MIAFRIWTSISVDQACAVISMFPVACTLDRAKQWRYWMLCNSHVKEQDLVVRQCCQLGVAGCEFMLANCYDLFSHDLMILYIDVPLIAKYEFDVIVVLPADYKWCWTLIAWLATEALFLDVVIDDAESCFSG